MSRQTPLTRNDFCAFLEIQTRWSDNDVYGHLNNTVHYKFFDTALTMWMVENRLVDPIRSQIITMVVDTGCVYFAELAFPEIITVGMRAERIGHTSITYKFALFGQSDLAAAQGHLTHVLVDRSSRRPEVIPDLWLSALRTIHKPETGSDTGMAEPNPTNEKTGNKLPAKETEL